MTTTLFGDVLVLYF